MDERCGLHELRMGREGGREGDVVVASVTRLSINMRRLAQQMVGHLRLFHCEAVRGVARHLRLNSLGLKRRTRLKQKQAVRTESLHEMRPKPGRGDYGNSSFFFFFR